MEARIPEKFNYCDICRADLGNIKLDTPLYCTSCIEEMEKLSMNPKRYKKYMEIKETLGKK